MRAHVHEFVFGIYPYICATVFLVGSLIRFDREQYTWRSGSSQLLRASLAILWGQLVHGLITILFSGQHLDGSTMIVLAAWAQHIVTLQLDAASLVAEVPWIFKLHMALGMTIFLLFPFSRLVHIWSAPVGYLFRNYQVVRARGNGRSFGARS